MMTMNDFLYAVQNRVDTNPSAERYGQAMWNVAGINNMLTESELLELAGSDIDPFYNSANVRAFLGWLVSNGRIDIGLV